MARSARPYVETFIRRIHANLAPDTVEGRSGFFVSRRDEGGLFLDGDERTEYSATVTRLLQEFVPNDDLSRRTVERYLQDALFESIDIPKNRQGTFDQRLKKALSELRTRLSTEPVAHRCFVPVNGFAAQDLPFRYSNVRFVKFGSAHRRQVLGSPGAKGHSDARRRLITQLRNGVLWGHPCAVLRIYARDFDSAQVKAHTETRAALDEVNFLHDLIPYNHGWLYLPGEAARELEIAPVSAADGGFSLLHSHVGPLAPLALNNLRKESTLLRHLRTLGALAKVSQKGGAAEVLRTAVQWAGRASIATKREQGFLLFAIALESAVLPDYGQELSYRLGLRVSRLLGRGRQQRSDLKNIVTKLYGLRSTIVHRGSYEITDDDLGRLRLVTKEVLLRLVSRRTLWSLSRKELGEWFESLVTR